MSDQQETDVATTNLILGLASRQKGRVKSSAIKLSTVIPAAKVNLNPEKVRIIGGDSDDFEQNVPPAIILEKSHDQISKIIVKCPCGRHAELICQYEDEEETPDLAQPVDTE